MQRAELKLTLERYEVWTLRVEGKGGLFRQGKKQQSKQVESGKKQGRRVHSECLSLGKVGVT